MRIAHIITRMILGGAQENTLWCCRDLMSDYDDDVLLITGPEAGPEGSLLDQVRAANVPLQIVRPLRREIRPWHDLRALPAIKRVLRAFRPDVVHTHSAKAGFWGRVAAHSIGVPAVVHTVHGAPFHSYQGRVVRNLIRWSEKFAADRCHALISVADAMTDLLVSADVASRDKFTTIYSGMEIEPFLDAGRRRQEARQSLGYEPQHVVVGKVARLFHLKGHEYVIQAARQVIARAPNTRFLLVGDGLLRGRIQRQIDAADLTPYFQLVGLVPAEEIPRLLAATDMVVHASLREGLARVLPQALLVGRPAISFDIDGAREVIHPGSTGLLVNAQDIDGLATAILELVENPPLRERMGTAGSRHCRELFAHQFMTRRIREVYTRVLGC